MSKRASVFSIWVRYIFIVLNVHIELMCTNLIICAFIFFPVDKGTTNEIILEDGKLFVKLRSEDYAFMGDATLDELTPFLYFLDKYVSKLVGRRERDNYFKSTRNMTLLDKITQSDIAYAMLLCENGVDVWDESAEIKKNL